jgi:hypothetical protein
MKFAPDVTYVQQLQRSKAFGLLSIKLIQIKLQSYILSEDLVILVFMGILLLRNEITSLSLGNWKLSTLSKNTMVQAFRHAAA